MSMRRNATWTFAGNVGYAACQWAVLVVLTKMASADDVGRFALGFAITAPVMIFASLLLRTVQATDASGEYAFGTYLGVRIMTTVLALVAIAAITLGSGYRGATFHLVAAIALAKAFEALSDCIFGLLQRHEDLRRVALSMLAKGVASVLAVTLVLGLTRSILAAMLAMALTWGAVLIAFDLPAAARLASIRPIIVSRSVPRLAWLAFPMGIMAGLQSLTTNVPRYAIESSLGAAALGHFAAIAYLLVAAYQPVMALWIAVSARLAAHFAGDRAAYRALAERTVAIAGGLGLATIVVAGLAGERLLTHTYSPEYAAHANVLTWLAIAASFGYVASALGTAVTAARRFVEQSVIAALALAVAALASYLLVPRFGLVGGAWALLAASVTQAACLGGVYLHVSIGEREPSAPAAAVGAEAPTVV
jgi:O-antigen/teichoic acid export membrane protein